MKNGVRGGERERVRVGKWKRERGKNEMRQRKEGGSKTVKNGVEGGSGEGEKTVVRERW